MAGDTPEEIARKIVEKWLPMSSAMLAERMLRGAIAAALTAERTAREKAEWELKHWQDIAELNAQAGKELGERAEKAEAERDTARAAALREAHEAAKRHEAYYIARNKTNMADACGGVADAILSLIPQEPVSHD